MQLMNTAEIKLAPPGTHRENVHFAPAVRRCEGMDVAQGPLRPGMNLVAEERADIQAGLPFVTALETVQGELYIALRIALRNALHYRIDHV